MTIKARLNPTPDHPGIGLSGLIPDPRFRTAVFLAGLAVSVWMTVDGLPVHAGIAALAALAVAGLAWLALATVNSGPLVPAAVAVMGVGGGVITSTDPRGLIFAGVGAASAAVAFDPLTAAVLIAASPVALVVATIAQGPFPGRLLAVTTVCLAGMVAGASRREIVQRARNAAVIATARQRAEVARAEAELAGERNRLGRDLHDVLAHTLGALSIQLTALDTLARTGTGGEELLAEIDRSHQLVSEGLDEARQAVRALRGEDTMPLSGQLERLCDLHGADLEVSGTPRPVRAEASLALYRVAQEALTNAAKHAPGGAVSVRLGFGSQEVTVTVLNSSPGPSASSRVRGSGGGYGLRGMRERVLQAGGQFEAGPVGDGGWQVAARLPG